MRYRNTKTNAIIETNLKINGGDWILDEEKKKAPAKKKSTKKEDAK